MTADNYSQADGIRRSQLWTVLSKTPMHLLYDLRNPKEDTPALLFGRAAHKFILEKETFFDEFAIAPQCDRRTKEGKQIYADFIEMAAGKSVISNDDFKTITEMADSINRDPFARVYLNSNAEYEQSFFWTDDATGEPCKVRPDCITEVDGKKYIVDYKTTDNCMTFEHSVRKYGYKFQAGMYREGVFQNTFEDYGFVFIAQEKTAPYGVRTFICSEGFIEEGYNQFRESIGIYHWCKENNCFYGYEGAEASVSELTEEGE